VFGRGLVGQVGSATRVNSSPVLTHNLPIY
jgi:hypothetical protein